MTIDASVLMRIGDWEFETVNRFGRDWDLSCFWPTMVTVATHRHNRKMRVIIATGIFGGVDFCRPILLALSFVERRALVRFLRSELRRMVLTETLNGISK